MIYPNSGFTVNKHNRYGKIWGAAAIGIMLLMTAATSIAAEKSNVKHSTGKVSHSMNSFKRGISIGHWLAKFDEKIGYGGDWFGEQDIKWIATQGFDHVRYPVDGRLWLKDDGTLDESKIAIFDRALQLTKANGMAVVLDMHFLPAGTYNKNEQDTRLFTDAIERKKAATFLAKVTQRFAQEGAALRFELINEPMAPANEQLNQLNTELIAAVRTSDKNRVLYITSNLSSTFETLADVSIPQDPNVALLLHYDEPSVFTHQRTSWKNYPDQMPAIHFPGKVPDLSTYLPKDHYAYHTSNMELTEKIVYDDFAKAQAWIAKHALGKEVYLGAFGVYQKAPEESRRNYLKTVRSAAEKHSWGWCIWDYKSSFGVRLENNTTTDALNGLFQ
jgi:endoglucanase